MLIDNFIILHENMFSSQWHCLGEAINYDFTLVNRILFLEKQMSPHLQQSKYHVDLEVKVIKI